METRRIRLLWLLGLTATVAALGPGTIVVEGFAAPPGASPVPRGADSVEGEAARAAVPDIPAKPILKTEEPPKPAQPAAKAAEPAKFAQPAANAAEPAKPAQPAAKAAEPVKPAQPAAKTAEPAKPTQPAAKAAETVKPTQPAAKAAEPAKLAQPAVKVAEPAKPAQPAAKAAEPAKPAQPAAKTTEPAKPVQPAAKTAEPAKPTQPAAKAAETAKPTQPAAKAAEPAKPAQPAAKAAEPVKPAQPKARAAEPVKPTQPAAKAAEPAKPAQPAEKAAEPAKPAQPAAKTTEPAKPAQPAAKTTEPAKPPQPAGKEAEPAKPAQPAAKTTEPAKPAQPAGKAAEPVKPAQPAAKAAEPAKPAQPAAKTTEPAKPAQPAGKAAEPVKSAQPAAKTTEPVKPAQPAAKTTEPAKPAQPAAKAAEPAKPIQPAAKAAEPAKPTQPAAKAAEPAKPAQPAAKAAEPAKPAQPAAKASEAAKSAQPTTKTVQTATTEEGVGTASRPLRILAVIPYNSRSHFVMFGALFRGLAARGHQVDVVSHFPLVDPPPNYRDLSLNGSYESWEGNVDMDLILSLNTVTNALTVWFETLDVCSKVLEHRVVKELLETDATYDVVISEVFGAECLLGMAHRSRAHLVGIISSVAPPGSLDRMGNPDNPAYVANYFLPYAEPLSFWQRMHNALYSCVLKRLQYLLCDRYTDALARRYFGPDLPSTSEMARNTSLILVNSHFSANQPRPMVPGVVEVGGLHIAQPRPLPQDLERFVSESPAGVVLFSLGTMVRVSTFSAERRRALWAALGALPVRVLLKSRDALPDAPPNVRVEPWLPQVDLLNHPKVVAFVTHGGLMGTQEAVWAGVPMLGLPMFADQHLNLATYVNKGVALQLKYDQLTAESLLGALRRITQDPGFRERAKALSRQFRDRPQSALASAVWWVEYVARHGGATHLRSAAADLPLYQYLLLDVLAVLVLVAALVLGFVWFALATVYRFLGFGSRGQRRHQLPTYSATGQRKRYTKTKQH